MNALSGFPSPRRRGARPGIAAQLSSLAVALVDAIEDEYRVFRAPETQNDDDAQGAAVHRVSEVERQILALPREAEYHHPDFRLLVALCHKHWLIMEGAYTDRQQLAECRLVDAVLAGSRFENIQMLWHLDGEVRPERPTDAEFAAAMGAAA